MTNSVDALFEEQRRVDKIYEQLKSENSISNIVDLVEELDEATAKAVLKKFIYAAKA